MCDHLLDSALDYDNDVEADLCEIANHMLGWDSELSTHLKLTDVDINDIKCDVRLRDPKLQRYD